MTDSTIDQAESALDRVRNDILKSLFDHDRLTRQSRSERYIEHRLQSATSWGGTWAIRLAWTPLDDDFIHLCYRLILKRKPDPSGFEHWQTLLLTRTCTRIEMIGALIQSPEVAAGGQETAPAWPHPRCLARIALLLRRIPLASPLAWTIWRSLTCVNRARRMEMAHLDGIDETQEINRMLGDTLEYVHNTRAARTGFPSHLS